MFGTTIRENYHIIKDIYSQIEPFKDRKAGALSGGMKQKLALSCALIHKPSVLFLDEPTTGVDPVSRKELWEMLRQLKQQGITILVSTPYMDEASLCDRIALILDGRFIGIDTPQHIADNFGEPLWAVGSDNMSKLLRDLRANPHVTSAFTFGARHHVTTDGKPTEQELRDYLSGLGHHDVEIETIRAGIEDCYMKLAREHR